MLWVNNTNEVAPTADYSLVAIGFVGIDVLRLARVFGRSTATV